MARRLEPQLSTPALSQFPGWELIAEAGSLVAPNKKPQASSVILCVLCGSRFSNAPDAQPKLERGRRLAKC